MNRTAIEGFNCIRDSFRCAAKRHISYIEKPRECAVDAHALAQGHLVRRPNTDRSNPSATTYLSASETTAVRGLVRVCQADDSLRVGHTPPVRRRDGAAPSPASGGIRTHLANFSRAPAPDGL